MDEFLADLRCVGKFIEYRIGDYMIIKYCLRVLSICQKWPASL